MRFAIALAFLLISNQVFADGFVCFTDRNDLKVTLFNKVMPNDGTRVPSVMVVSDPKVQEGRRTISKFSTKSTTLRGYRVSEEHFRYTGRVDFRFNEIGRPGEYILGTRLSEVATIALNVHFTYGDNLQNGEQTDALVVLTKRSGEKHVRLATCERYLKAEEL